MPETLSPSLRKSTDADIILHLYDMDGNRIPYTPLPYQLVLHYNDSYIRVFMAGNRAGKSCFAVIEALMMIMNYRNNAVMMISPTFKQAKKSIIPHLQNIISASKLRHITYNKTDSYFLNDDNGSIIWIMSAEIPDSIQGCEVSHIFLDEPFLYDRVVYERAITRLSLDRGRRGITITGTPEGGGIDTWVYSLLYDEAPKKILTKPAIITVSSTKNPYLPQGLIQSWEEELDAQQLAITRDGQFTELGSGNVYYNFNPNLHVKPCQYDPELKLYLTLDFNVEPMCGSIIQKQNINGELIDCVVDEIHIGKNATTAHFASRFKQIYCTHKAGLDITGDPTGNSRNTKTEVGGFTDFGILKKELDGIPHLNMFATGKIPLKESINLTNSKLLNSKGETKIRIDPRNKYLIRDLERVQRTLTGEIDKRGEADGLTHHSDAFRYYIYRFCRGSSYSGLTSNPFN